MCILCTIKASKLGDRIMIESFLAVISYWTTGHMFSMGWFARSKVDDHDAWCDLCARKHLGSECVWCQETNQVKKTARKEFKVYGIKIVRIFLESYRIPNMVLQMSSVLGWHLWHDSTCIHCFRQLCMFQSKYTVRMFACLYFMCIEQAMAFRWHHDKLCFLTNFCWLLLIYLWNIYRVVLSDWNTAFRYGPFYTNYTKSARLLGLNSKV